MYRSRRRRRPLKCTCSVTAPPLRGLSFPHRDSRGGGWGGVIGAHNHWWGTLDLYTHTHHWGTFVLVIYLSIICVCVGVTFDKQTHPSEDLILSTAASESHLSLITFVQRGVLVLLTGAAAVELLLYGQAEVRGSWSCCCCCDKRTNIWVRNKRKV